MGAISSHFTPGRLHLLLIDVTAPENFIVHSPLSEEGQKNKNQFPQNNLPPMIFVIRKGYGEDIEDLVVDLPIKNTFVEVEEKNLKGTLHKSSFFVRNFKSFRPP